MIMVGLDSYERELAAQKKPYLQWLGAQESALREEYGDTKDTEGKHVVLLPFLSCDEPWVEYYNKAIEQGKELWLFYQEGGSLAPCSAAVFAQYAQTADILYADEDYLDEAGEHCEPWFKSEYSPDTLRSFFYYGSIFAIRAGFAAKLWKQFIWETGMKNEAEAGIYEFILYASGQTKRIGHIDKVLYTSQDTKKLQELAGYGSRLGQVSHTNWWRLYHGKTAGQTTPVSVIIPSKDNPKVLFHCIESLLGRTKYPHYELIIVDNGSTEENRLWITSHIQELRKQYPQDMQYLYEPMPFNFSRMCNAGAAVAKGSYLLFLNDDIEVIEEDWLENMLEWAVQLHVGAVGAKLLYPRDNAQEPYRIQHTGITNMGIGPAHKLAGLPDEGSLYHGHNLVCYDMLAVTAACLLVSREKLRQAGGFDEALQVAYNDVDLCFSLYEAGYYNVQCNTARLLHHESLSRGQDDTPEKRQRLESELSLLYGKHPALRGRDAFYSPKLVQWKRDVEYTCNYLFACDKPVTPKKGGALPHAYRSRLLRRLTGQNESMLTIDSVELHAHTVEIEGWYVLREHDNALLERWLVLLHEESRQVYQAPLYPKLREDVEALFLEQTATQHTALSGLHAVIEKEKLPKGHYTIGVYVRFEAAGGLRKHGKRIQYAQGDGFLL